MFPWEAFFLKNVLSSQILSKKKIVIFTESKDFSLFFFLNSEENLDNSSPLPLSNSKATLILNVLITRAY